MNASEELNSSNESQTSPVESVEVVKEEPIIQQDSINPIFSGSDARKLAQELIHTYFTSQINPLTKHHIDSYDQFLQKDLISIIKAENPILIKKEPYTGTNINKYKYEIKIYIGGLDSSEITIGIPSITLNQGKDIRILYPNEARLRNLTYASQIEATIRIEITYLFDLSQEPVTLEPIIFNNFPLCNIPLMLHSKYCLLHNKPLPTLREMGECPQDQGAYFIIDGSEKVLITRQQGAFNTLYITPKKLEPKIEYYGSMACLNPVTRQVRSIGFFWTRERTMKLPIKKIIRYYPSVMEVSVPFIRKPVPLFVLFRALGIQTDKDIMNLIFPDPNNPETKYLEELLIPSINAAFPFLDTYSALQYMKSLTKGFSLARVQDALTNHFFAHIENRPGARAAFLAECVRQILRVVKGIEEPPSKDDTRNQRLLSSGFLTQMLFQNSYSTWIRAIKKTIDEAYNYNKELYSDDNFKNIFQPGNIRSIFNSGMVTTSIMRGFKGKWSSGSGGEETGVLQAMSRLSYLDFMSHCRRVVLDFDTGMKLTGPRRLNPSQFGYFCTSETPSGSHIGVTKNLSIFTSISTASRTEKLVQWLFDRGTVVPCEEITPSLATVMVPVFINGGIIGYTGQPKKLARVLRLMKRSGCLPPFSSNGFNIPQRRVFIYMDEGRPLRPLLICEPRGTLPVISKFKGIWKDLILGSYPGHESMELSSTDFIDPLASQTDVVLDSYIEHLSRYQGVIEYVDPYEQNETYIINVPEHIVAETTHMEIHPSTILGLLGVMIPYPNHNQSPRNQLSASQSKQGLSLYATNWMNRFDNNSHVLSYGEAPLSRTLYQDYIGNGQMYYGMNIVLAMGIYSGYNQEDGIIMNMDALQRGLFRSVGFRTYESFEEDDAKTKMRTRIANPSTVPGWLDINVGYDYSKLDESGIVRVGEYVDQKTVIVGKYLQNERGQMKDASLTPQVWTRGRVENVVITVSNTGLRLVKIRVVQDRVPELGDKFSNRHGQKGTLNCVLKSQDLPHTESGIVPDMIMNPHAIPSRMTIGQLLESLGGKVGSLIGSINNATPFMNEGSPHETFGQQLETLGFEKYGNEILYNGQTGDMMEAQIFIGNLYTMRLKHMTEDKWNARADGRKEQRTHQPTGGRGNEGGLKIGEMERDAITGHGISGFVQESMMKRSDGTSFYVCNGCGTIPIYNEKQNLYICSMCDGPIQFSGETANNLEPIPPIVRSAATFSKIEMPYATKLFMQEMGFFMNIGLRMLTTHDVTKISTEKLQIDVEEEDGIRENITLPLPTIIYPEINIPEEIKAPEIVNVEQTQKTFIESMRKEEASAESSAPSTASSAPSTGSSAPSTASSAPSTGSSSSVESSAPSAPPQVNQPLEIVQEESQAPTIVIDTSEPAMQAEGLSEVKPQAQPQIQQSQPRRRIAKQPQQQQPIVASGSPAAAQLQADSIGPVPTGGDRQEDEKPMSYSTVINVTKLG